MMFKSIINSRTFLIIFAMVLIAIAHVYSFFFFSPTEGWWQAYGYLYNQDFQLYKDINIAYTPLFILFNAWLLKISHLYIFHRIIGFLIVLITFVFLFLTLEKMKYSYLTAILSSCIAILVSMLNIVYIVFDYPILLNLFVVISLYFFIISVQMKENNRVHFLITILVALFAVLTFYTKQNVGLLLSGSYFVSYFYLLYLHNTPNNRFRLFIYLVSSAIILVIFMKLTHMSFDILKLLTVQNDAKGNPLTVLLRIFDIDNLKIFAKAILLILIFFLIKQYKVVDLIRNKFKVSENSIIWFIFIIILYILIAQSEKAVILISVIYVIYLGLGVILKKEVGFLFFPLGIQILAITMSAGLCIAGIYIISAFAFAYLFTFFERSLKNNYQRTILILTIILTFVITYKKINDPYQWWGLNQSSAINATYSLPFEEMRYIKVDKMTSTFFNDVKHYADQYKSDNMYFYPHIPSFYQLYNSHPISQNLVQWFDVISTDNLKKELRLLKQKEPDLIVVLDPPWSAYIGHAELKKSTLLQPKFIEFLDQSVLNGKYKLEKYQIYDNKVFGDNLGQYADINISLRVNNPMSIGQTCENSLITHNVIGNDFTILSIQHNGVKINDIRNYKLASNDLIAFKVKFSLLNELIKIFGTPDITDQKFYSYRIYTKIRDLNETH